MLTRKPSIKTLRAVFGAEAKTARRIFEMTRAELEKTPAGAALVASCLNPPETYTLRMAALNAAGRFYGVESAQTIAGEWAEYLNTGDVYAPTIIYWRGRYRIAALGEFIETMERRGCARFK